MSQTESEETTVQAPADARRRQRLRRRKRKKWLKIVVSVLLGIGLLAALTVSLLPKPIEVLLAEATRGPMRVTVDEDGKTRAQNRYLLSAPLSGNMNRIRLQPGEHVEEGQNILQIVPATPPLLDKRSRANAQTRLLAAQAGSQMAGAEVERAGAALAQAEIRRSDLVKLVESGVSSKLEAKEAGFLLTLRQQELRAAQFSAKVRRQDEASARAALGLLDGRGEGEEALDISAPVSGQVLRVLRQDEQGIVSAGTPLLEIADLSVMEIVADILTADAIQIVAGAKTRIVRWGGGEELVGHVRRVEPSAFTRVSALGVEEQRVLVVIDLDSDPEQWAALGDGYRVEVEIVVWEAEDVLSVPAGAVFRNQGQWAVYRADGGIARLTPVEIGHRNDTRVEILSGLGEGALLIAHPSDRVVDGVAVAKGG